MGMRGNKQANAAQILGMLNQVRTRLPAQAFVEGGTLRFAVPTGKVLKGFIVAADIVAAPTYSVAPTLEPAGVAASFIDSVSFNDDDANTIKKVTPAWMRDQCRYLTGLAPTEFYKTNSTSISGASKGTLATPFAIGSSTQSNAFRTSFPVHFECVMARKQAYHRTYYNVGNQVNNYIEVKLKRFANMEQYGGSNITACTGSGQIEIILIEAPAYGQDESGNDIVRDVFRQTYLEPQYSGATQELAYSLPKQGNILGIGFQLKDGSNRTLIDLETAKNVRLKLVRDTTQTIADVSLLNIMEENQCKRLMQEVVNGTGYMTLLNNEFYESALKAKDFKQLDLLVTLPAGMSFSPAILQVRIDDIISPQKA